MTSLEDVRSAHTVAQAIGDDYRDATARLHRTIAAALDDGHSAIELADTLGVTRARIYQLRNKATP